MPKTKREFQNELAILDVQNLRVIKGNTCEYWRDGDRIIRLHETNILTFSPDGSIWINTGGYVTKTTCDRINEHLNPLSYFVCRRQFQLYIGRRSDLTLTKFQGDRLKISPQGVFITQAN